MKTTSETILEISEKLKENEGVDKDFDYAVLKPISVYDKVDFESIASHFTGCFIDSYTMTNKIVIRIPKQNKQVL